MGKKNGFELNKDQKYETNSNKKICDGFQQNTNSKIKRPKYFLNDLIKFMKRII